MILAVVNFASFFLPWVAISATGNTSVFGEIISSIGSSSVTGFGLMEYSVLGVTLYIIPIVLFVLPLMKSTKEISRYLYLFLPVIAVAKDIGSNIQKSTFIKCPKCGSKVLKGRGTCPKCGRILVK